MSNITVHDFFIACPEMTKEKNGSEGFGWVLERVLDLTWCWWWWWWWWKGEEMVLARRRNGDFSWWYIWPRRNLQHSRYETGLIRQNTSDWKVELRPPGGCGFVTLGRRLCLIRNASDFSLRPQAQMQEALWLCHVTFSSSICEGKPKSTKRNKTNEQTKQNVHVSEKTKLLFFFRAPPSEELDSYYIWI